MTDQPENKTNPNVNPISTFLGINDETHKPSYELQCNTFYKKNKDSIIIDNKNYSPKSVFTLSEDTEYNKLLTLLPSTKLLQEQYDSVFTFKHLKKFQTTYLTLFFPEYVACLSELRDVILTLNMKRELELVSQDEKLKGNALISIVDSYLNNLLRKLQDSNLFVKLGTCVGIVNKYNFVMSSGLTVNNMINETDFAKVKQAKQSSNNVFNQIDKGNLETFIFFAKYNFDKVPILDLERVRNELKTNHDLNSLLNDPKNSNVYQCVVLRYAKGTVLTPEMLDDFLKHIIKSVEMNSIFKDFVYNDVVLASLVTMRQFYEVGSIIERDTIPKPFKELIEKTELLGLKHGLKEIKFSEDQKLVTSSEQTKLLYRLHFILNSNVTMGLCDMCYTNNDTKFKCVCGSYICSSCADIILNTCPKCLISYEL